MPTATTAKKIDPPFLVAPPSWHTAEAPERDFDVLTGAVPVHEDPDAGAVTQRMDPGAVTVSGLPQTDLASLQR